jgi:hypothetical protein
MKNNDYLIPGIASILVAVLSPLYWLFVFSSNEFDSDNYYVSNEFGFTNVLLLLIGILTVYIYHSLRNILHDHHNYRRVDWVLFSMIGICVLFYAGTFLLDLVSIVFGGSVGEAVVPWLWVASIVMFGIVDILLAVMLLTDRHELSGLIIGFAALTLIIGILELSVIFSFAVIFLFPVAALILAAHFLRKPETIEIV